MLYKPVFAIAALLQFALPASAAFIFCAGATIDGSCPADKGVKTDCQDICGNCKPNCFGGGVQDLGATCCTQADGTINIFCFRTGKNNC
ncbi:hypothetical protein CDEST_11373 [Colletotrichum destructivum]|uniref:Uncharacterized protein n=1 Tax=Colletotrichum destructivum TaxID=34406 RepID=A0AAX4IT06_9PEZI|nr:hypothetical protein CDEST_11373 [Colletotrichum destructivum]